MARVLTYNDKFEAVKKYHRFKFRKRPSGNYTPQQKSAITRQFNKLWEEIAKVDLNRSTFISGNRTKIRGFDGVKTNKGLFYKYPGAKIVRVKEGRKVRRIIKIKYKNRRDLFIPFPKSIVYFYDKIILYVEKLIEKYRPDFINWSYFGNRGGTPYLPHQFLLGASAGPLIIGIKSPTSEDNSYFNGVFFGWFPED